MTKFIIIMLVLVSFTACSSKKKSELPSNKKLAAQILERSDVKTMEQVKAEEGVATKMLRMDATSPVMSWQGKNAPYALVQLEVKSKARSLVIKSSYAPEDFTHKRAIVPVVILLGKENLQLPLKRTYAGDNPYCGNYHCLEVFFSLKKIPAGQYKALIVAPIFEGKKADENMNKAAGVVVHHTFFGDLEWSISDSDPK